MSNLSKRYNKDPKVFFIVCPDAMRPKVFHVYQDGSFTDVDILYIRIDNVVQKHLDIKINDKEWSVTINEEMGILFADEFSLEEFLDEIFFAMEELHNIDDQARTTLPDKIVSDLPSMLKFKIIGEEDGEKLDDRQDQQEQSN